MQSFRFLTINHKLLLNLEIALSLRTDPSVIPAWAYMESRKYMKLLNTGLRRYDKIKDINMNNKIKIWDAAQYLETEEDMAAYLEAVLEENDSALVAAALGDIARAKGMTQIARKAGLGRESLYKALSPDGNPEFSTVLKVVSALGLKLHAATGKKKKAA
jgi:probable addiction module antidote protein